MEELREKLIKLINEKGLLNEKTILVSQELDKLIVHYYKSNFNLGVE
ncbi:sporulation protein Spo0E [Clostridium beijerinckii]|nr:sporulation protein Spo0E [Clostridium beijerinckii]